MPAGARFRDPPREGLPVMHDRVAVVTGASSGSASNRPRRFAGEGWRVVLLARREDRLRAPPRSSSGVRSVRWGRRDRRRARGRFRSGPSSADSPAREHAGIPGRARSPRSTLTGSRSSSRELPCQRVVAARVSYPGSKRRTLRRRDIVSVAGTVAFPPSGPYSASKYAARLLPCPTRSCAGEDSRPYRTRLVETEGFPQASALRSALIRRIWVGRSTWRGLPQVIKRDQWRAFVAEWYRSEHSRTRSRPSVAARLPPVTAISPCRKARFWVGDTIRGRTRAQGWSAC